MKPPLIVHSRDPSEPLTVLLPEIDFGPRSVVASVRLRVVWDDPWAPEPVPVGVEVTQEDGPGVVTVTLHADGTHSAEANPERVDGEG